MITDQQLRAIAYVARAIAAEQGKVWNEAGIVAKCEPFRSWSLAELAAEVNSAAADPNVDTPGVIGRQGRRFTATRPVMVESAPVGTRCTICGRVREQHHNADHDFHRPAETSTEDWAAHVAALKAELAPTSGPTTHRTPEDFADAKPEMHARIERLKAACPGLVEQPLQEPTEGETA